MTVVTALFSWKAGSFKGRWCLFSGLCDFHGKSINTITRDGSGYKCAVRSSHSSCDNHVILRWYFGRWGWVAYARISIHTEIAFILYHQSRVLFSSHILLFSAVNSEGKETCKCVNDHPNCQASGVVETLGLLFRMHTLFIMSRLSLGILAYVLLQLFLADAVNYRKATELPRMGQKIYDLTSYWCWVWGLLGGEFYLLKKTRFTPNKRVANYTAFSHKKTFSSWHGIGFGNLRGWWMERFKLNLRKL